MSAMAGLAEATKEVSDEMQREMCGCETLGRKSTDNATLEATTKQLGKFNANMAQRVARITESRAALLVGNTAQPQRQYPFDQLQQRDIRDLRLGVVGRDTVAVSVATSLARMGIKRILLCETQQSSDEKSQRLVNFTTLQATLGSQSETTTEALVLDPAKEEDKGPFHQAMAQCDLLLLCSGKASDKAAIEAVSAAASIPWITCESDARAASFWFQFQLIGVEAVADVDTVSEPYVNLALAQEEEEGGGEAFAAGMDAVYVSAAQAFAGLIASSVVRFWLGSPDTVGYCWFSPAFGKLSIARIVDIPLKMTPEKYK